MVTLTMRRLWIPVLMMLLGITASEGEWQFPSGFFFFFLSHFSDCTVRHCFCSKQLVDIPCVVTIVVAVILGCCMSCCCSAE